MLRCFGVIGDREKGSLRDGFPGAELPSVQDARDEIVERDDEMPGRGQAESECAAGPGMVGAGCYGGHHSRPDVIMRTRSLGHVDG